MKIPKRRKGINSRYLEFMDPVSPRDEDPKLIPKRIDRVNKPIDFSGQNRFSDL